MMESGEEKGMSRRFSNVCMTLAFMGLFLFLGSSCAKKQVQVSEPPKAAPVQEVKKEAPAPVEDAAAKEAKLRAEKEKQLEKMRKAFEDESIYFDFDKYEIKADAKTTLQKKADFLAANTRYSLRIEGHCDERGTNEYNLALGERRANSAKEFLVALGIAPARITTISYGEERPAVEGSNEDAWSKNRRDEFKLIY